MKKHKMKPEDFTVSRHAAAKFLGVGDRLLMTLNIPFFRIGKSLIRFRQIDLDKLLENSIHNANG